MMTLLRIANDSDTPIETPQDAESFNRLCMPHYDDLVHFAQRLAGQHDRARAEDVVHDALISAMRAWPDWIADGEPEIAVRSWLYRIVSNKYMNSYRDEREHHRKVGEARGEVMLETYGHASEPDPRNELDFGIGDEVLDAIDELSIDHRRVVDMFYMQSMSCGQIAKALRVPKNTVFTRLKRAREYLRENLRGYAATEYGLRDDIMEDTVDQESEAEGPLEATERLHADAGAVDRVVAHDDAGALRVA